MDKKITLRFEMRLSQCQPDDRPKQCHVADMLKPQPSRWIAASTQKSCQNKRWRMGGPTIVRDFSFDECTMKGACSSIVNRKNPTGGLYADLY
jgi:hypothetical protein